MQGQTFGGVEIELVEETLHCQGDLRHCPKLALVGLLHHLLEHRLRDLLHTPLSRGLQNALSE